MNPLSIDPKRLERLRSICLALADASEKEAWGDPTWRVRDKIFAMQKGNYAGGRPSLWLKAADGVQAMLVESDPKLFFVPPYVGKKGWIGVWLDGKTIAWPMLSELVAESHRLTAPKRRSPAPVRSKKKPARRRGSPARR